MTVYGCEKYLGGHPTVEKGSCPRVLLKYSAFGILLMSACVHHAGLQILGIKSAWLRRWFADSVVVLCFRMFMSRCSEFRLA